MKWTLFKESEPVNNTIGTIYVALASESEPLGSVYCLQRGDTLKTEEARTYYYADRWIILPDPTEVT